LAKDLTNEIFNIKADIAAVAGSHAQNSQQKHQEFYF
jgi:hypothetical protein